MIRTASGGPAAGEARPRLRIAGLALAAGMLACVAGCGDSSGAGSAVVDSEVRTFVDPSRPTAANGSFGGAPERTIETRIWLRQTAPRGSTACRGGACALVVLAHGFGGSTARFDGYARSLAEAGYVVAAPSFPLTNDRAPGGHLSAIGDVREQPADLSFTIDSLLEAASEAGDALRGRIDAERIAVMGHSLGGATVVGATRLDCCTDPRIDAVITVAPGAVLLPPLVGEAHHREGPPTLVVNGSADPVVTPALAQAFYDSIAPPRVYLLIPGAHHSDLIEDVGVALPYLAPTTELSLAFLEAHLGGDGDLLEETIAALRAAGNTVLAD